ncbi:MAG: hypothetical protein H6701_06610 [Myxococcales bacterium]|nr:hypothetical protein [Myxococcales bacterium]
MLRTVLVVALLAAWGCDEEAPPPPNKPRVISADAICRPVEGVPKLHQVTVEVEDLDGYADLVPPLALVEASALAMQATPTDRVSTDPETGEPAECLDPDGKCTVRYTWQRESDSEQIYCGEGLDGLEVFFEVTDVAGFLDRRYIPTHAQ